jgi:signal transduction histidine kinase
MLEKELSLDISEEVEGNPLAKSLLLSRGVKIDVNLNKQILYNILLNACKFNKQNGSISISVEVQIPDSLQDSKFQKRVRKINDLELIIKIVDTGFGMNKSKLNSLFKLFHKVKKSAVVGIDNEDGATIKELRTSGHGLGMFLSDSLVKFLKGNIQVDSIPDVGTTVKVT